MGNDFPYITWIVGILLLCLGFPLVFLCRQPTENIKEKSPVTYKSLYVVVIMCFISAVTFFMISLYFPALVGSQETTPQIGVSLFMFFNFISACALMYILRYSHHQRLNFYKWLSFFTIQVFLFITLVFIMMLLYVIPAPIMTTYPFLAGISGLCFLFYGVVIVYGAIYSHPQKSS